MSRRAFKCDACGAPATTAVEGLLGGKPMTFTACDDHVETFAGRQAESKGESHGE